MSRRHSTSPPAQSRSPLSATLFGDSGDFKLYGATQTLVDNFTDFF